MPIIQHARPLTGAKNDGVVAVARARLAAVTPLAQKATDNSFQVNAIPCLIYQRLRPGFGRPCGCSAPRNAGQPTGPEFDDQGRATPQHVLALLTGQSFGIAPYGSSAVAATEVQAPVPAATPGLDNLSELLGVSDYPNVADAPSDVPALPMGAGDARACPVCFGTGIHGGYQVLGGGRSVLLLADGPGAVVVGREFPWAVDTTLQGVELWVTVPLNHAVLCVRCFDGPTPVDATVTVGVPGTELANPQVLATGAPVRLMVSGHPSVTHVEVQWLSQSLYGVDFPHLSRTGDVTNLDTTSDVEVNFSPLCPLLRPGDVLADTHWGKLWRMHQTNDNSDAQGRQQGQDGSARVIQPYEIHSLLWVTKSRAHAQVNFKPRANAVVTRGVRL